jgi:hypothetical protein
LHSSPNIFRIIKSGRLNCVEDGVRITQMRTKYEITRYSHGRHILKKKTAVNAKIETNALAYWKTIAAVTG